MKQELWDAYDCHGNRLGFDLVRGESLPEGACHLVVEVYTLTEAGEILITQRHPSKPFGLQWEVTGGAVQKGETPLEGAVRELREETGIQAEPESLRPLYVYSPMAEGLKMPAVFHCYLLAAGRERPEITLQEGETVSFRFLPYEEFRRFVRTDAFVDTLRDRFLRFDEQISEQIRRVLS